MKHLAMLLFASTVLTSISAFAFSEGTDRGNPGDSIAQEFVDSGIELVESLKKDPIAGVDADALYAAGMTSHASVTVMLACEDEWDIEFPQQMLKKSTFASVANIRDALAELGVDDASVASA